MTGPRFVTCVTGRVHVTDGTGDALYAAWVNKAHTSNGELIMKGFTKLITVALVALVAMAAAAGAQGAAKTTMAKPKSEAKGYKKDLPDSLTKQAKITESAAAATALAKVANGKIESVELEHEGGNLLYSYDIKVAGKSGIDEVQVNAMTGDVIGNVVHENAAAEKKEKAAEAKEKKSGVKKPVAAKKPPVR